MPGRQWDNGSKYRYGFNGKKNDNEIKGEGDLLDYMNRIYDPRVGRFLSVDPFSDKFPSESGYSFAGNNPINMTDYNGLFKISPWFAKRYPTLAKFLEFAIPTLKDDIEARDRWIVSMGIFNSEKDIDWQKGIKIWEDLLTFGTGPYISPMRPNTEEYSMGNQSLSRFFGQDRGGIEGGDYGYPDNLSIGYSYFDDVETALKKGNNTETGYRMFLMYIMLMHEGGHWARERAGLPARRGFRDEYEDGAAAEEGIFGTRFNYTTGFNSSGEGGELNSLNTKKATEYYNSNILSIGNVSGLIIPKIYLCWNVKGVKALAPSKGQPGDKTINDNHDNENSTPPKRDFTYGTDREFDYSPDWRKKQ